MAGIAEVTFDLPISTTFHYRIPREWKAQVAIGKRVSVPFGHRRLTGMVVGLPRQSKFKALKPIESLLDSTPIMAEELLDLTRWIAEVYQAGWGQTIQAALPGPLRRGPSSLPGPRQGGGRSSPQIFGESAKYFGGQSGEVTDVVPTAPLKLTLEQQQALKAILKEVNRHCHKVFLIHGVTSSGKTEVYLQAIQEAMSRGRSSIVLVPEISLTPQTLSRFEARFGRKAVAVLHSRMLESRRLREWHRIQSGQARIVVGARSAIFAPVRELGMIVVDEEHEPSYKQEDSPRYHAREVAIRRGELNRAVVLLGSATPALETYHQAIHHRYGLLTLRNRIDEVPLPKVDLVDMRREREVTRRGKIFSHLLEEELRQTLERHEQAILFLNRRGFSTFVQCRGCGHVLRCKNCSVTLNYHIESKSMICHHCHASTPAPEVCPQCRSEYVRFQGLGTQRLESELARLFPQANIARMDTDSTHARESHAKLLRAFGEHRIDFLVGTQMIAKGLDFPRVTLVGVISADTALHQPDFRSAERTFHLLTQVAGRAGRRQLPGRVIVQTNTPHHYAIQAAKRHDYEAFYQQEIEIRRELRLPPFVHLVQWTARSLRESRASAAAQSLAQSCRQHLPKTFEVLGPAPAVISKLRRQYRWQVTLKADSLDHLREHLSPILQEHRTRRGVTIGIDVDPL